MTTQLSFDRLVSRFDRPSQIVRDVQALANDDPELARLIVRQMLEILGESGTSPHRATTNGSSVRGKVTQFDRVTKVFIENKNTAVTKVQLIVLSGVNDSALHTVMYTTNPGSFQRMPNPDGGRAVVVRLTNDALAAAQHRHGGENG